MIDVSLWMQQPLIWGERCRGRALPWMPDGDWFANDPIGPTPHAHDDATEVAYLAQGSLEIQVGATKRVYTRGDFILMPPDKFHNYWFRGDEPACLFVLVAPNHKSARIRTTDYRPGAFEGDALYARVLAGEQPPSDAYIQTQLCTLAPGAAEGPGLLAHQDRVIYILSGVAEVRLGSLSGPLGPDQYQYLPATFVHRVANAGLTPLTYLSMTVTDPATVPAGDGKGHA